MGCYILRTLGAAAVAVTLSVGAPLSAAAQSNCDAIRADMERQSQAANAATGAGVARLRTLEVRYNRCLRNSERAGSGARSSSSRGGGSAGDAGGQANDDDSAAAAAALMGAIIGGAAGGGSGNAQAAVGAGMGAVIGGILGDVLSSGPPEEPKLKHSRRRKAEPQE